MHTFCRQWITGQRYRCWQEGYHDGSLWDAVFVVS